MIHLVLDAEDTTAHGEQRGVLRLEVQEITLRRLAGSRVDHQEAAIAAAVDGHREAAIRLFQQHLRTYDLLRIRGFRGRNRGEFTGFPCGTAVFRWLFKAFLFGFLPAGRVGRLVASNHMAPHLGG